MADQARARRLAKRIVTIVATELEHQVKDPRLAMITVTAATVTPDLRDATVYYTVYGDETEQQDTAAALASATGVLRSAVGKQTGIKFTPTLAFKQDTVPDTSRAFEQLLAATRASDAEIAQRAAGAAYAGEADPYRAPRAADEDSDDDVADVVDEDEDWESDGGVDDGGVDDGGGDVGDGDGAEAARSYPGDDAPAGKDLAHDDTTQGRRNA